MKAALNDDMYFKPLAFEYPKDKRAVRVEDQLMLGNEIMIAPVTNRMHEAVMFIFQRQ